MQIEKLHSNNNNNNKKEEAIHCWCAENPQKSVINNVGSKLHEFSNMSWSTEN